MSDVSVWAMMSERFARHPRARHVLIAAVVLVVTRLWFFSLTDDQRPLLKADSIVFLEIAGQPASIAHLAYPKPWTVPAVFRLVDADPDRIVILQRELAFWSWCLFGVALVLAMRRPITRVLALIAAAALLIAPARIGFTGAILSESVADSLFALGSAAALGLVAAHTIDSPTRRRVALGLTIALAVITPLWILSRDVHAICAVVIVLGAVIWLRLARVRPRPWMIALALICVAGGAIGFISASRAPREPTGISFHDGWILDAKPRSMYPLINNLVRRVLPDDTATELFRDDGLPWSEELASMRGRYPFEDEERFLRDPQFAPVHHWLREHGYASYLAWRLRHPLTTAYEIARQGWSVIGVRSMERYMPGGWHAWGDGNVIADGFRWSTELAPFVLALIAIAPFGFRRARGPLRGLASCMIAAGLIGAVAAVLADASEISRHCWGLAQITLVGLIVMALAAIDGHTPRA